MCASHSRFSADAIYLVAHTTGGMCYNRACIVFVHVFICRYHFWPCKWKISISRRKNIEFRKNLHSKIDIHCRCRRQCCLKQRVFFKGMGTQIQRNDQIENDNFIFLSYKTRRKWNCLTCHQFLLQLSCMHSYVCMSFLSLSLSLVAIFHPFFRFNFLLYVPSFGLLSLFHFVEFVFSPPF